MRGHHLPIALLLILSCPRSWCQTDSSDSWNTYEGYEQIHKGDGSDSGKGKVRYQHGEGLDSLLSNYRRYNKEFPKIQGYRIQLFFGKREKAERLKAQFKEKHPETEAYIDYLAPNFRLRVGNFRTRIDAYRFMQEIGNEFGRSYIVRTQIELPKLSMEE